MLCPKCDHKMEVVTFNTIEVDRCTHCFGLWFDFLEQEDLKKLEGADAIDIGDEFVGAKYDQIRDITCPHCTVQMQRVEYQDEDTFTDINFERCQKCKGSFFDAGEFRDYMDEEIFKTFEKLYTTID